MPTPTPPAPVTPTNNLLIYQIILGILGDIVVLAPSLPLPSNVDAIIASTAQLLENIVLSIENPPTPTPAPTVTK